MYQTAPNIFNLVNELKINGGSGDYEDLINADLLIIDDLGTENQSGSKYAEILNILITRSGNDSIKPPCKTIISSNLGLQEIYKVYDERIGSRIAGGFDMYRIFGDDLRLKYKKP
jgi:DNA replication protein DnaC